MTVYYVDYEGAAGTEDGSSFANRAFKVEDLTLTAGDEVRIKKTSDPTSLGTGHVRRAPPSYGYNLLYKSGSNITYSSTDGETKLTSMGNGWLTGDIIHIYHNDSTAGKSISGLWRVTVESGTETNASLKLDNFPGPSDTTASSTAFRWHACTNAIYLSTDDLTKSIASRDAYRGSWTATGTDVSANYSYPTSYSSFTQSHDYIAFTGSDQFTIGTTASNGKLAYYQLPSALDLSSYQQVSFNFRQSLSNNGNSNKFSLRLCTDTSGDTSVHTIPIDYKNQYYNAWTGLTVDLGTNLNSSIQSIALYQDSTPASSQTIYLQNIIACKASSAADSITLDKLVGLNTSDDTAWYPVQFIWDNILFLKTQARGKNPFGYYGGNAAAFSATNTSATIYQREQVRPYDSSVMQTDSTSWDGPTADGTEASPITISGGWDATSMSTRNGKTCIEFNGSMSPLDPSGDHIQTSHIYLTNFGRAFNYSGRYQKWSDIGLSHFDRGLIFDSSNTDVKGVGLDFIIGVQRNYSSVVMYQNSTFTGDKSDFYIKQAVGLNHSGYILYSSSGAGLSSWSLVNAVACGCIPVYTETNSSIHIDTLKWGYNSQTGQHLYSYGTLTIDTFDCENFFYRCLQTDGICKISDFNYTPDTTFSTDNYYRYSYGLSPSYSFWSQGGLIRIVDIGTFKGAIYANNSGRVQVKGSTESFGRSLATGGIIESIDHEGVSGANKTFFQSGNTVASETTTRHTASGVAWKCTQAGSCTLSLGKIVVSANSAVTVGIWTYKSHASNAKVTLKIPADALRGFALQTVDTSSTSAFTWVKIEKTFTPTVAGPIEIQVEMQNLAGSNYVIIDDLEVSQA